MTSAGGIVRVGKADQRNAVELIVRDVTRTIGMTGEVDAEIRKRARELGEFVEGPAELTLRLAEDIQQYLHDVFIDTVWPACPVHPWHPLWLRDDRGELWWSCLETDTRVAELGTLPG
jgi:hypothetical protein